GRQDGQDAADTAVELGLLSRPEAQREVREVVRENRVQERLEQRQEQEENTEENKDKENPNTDKISPN
ncbi:MAG: hypothetical protein ACPGUC_03970, partial [Gammaproteobacteria bacterium]